MHPLELGSTALQFDWWWFSRVVSFCCKEGEASLVGDEDDPHESGP